MVEVEPTYLKNLGDSIVREYLFRRGLKLTLKCMDEELPRTENSFNNRTLLARELKIEQHVRDCKQNNCSGKSLIEIILAIFLKEHNGFIPNVSKMMLKNNSTRKSFDKWSRVCSFRKQFANSVSIQKSQMLNINGIMWFYRQLSGRGVNKIDFPTFVNLYCNCFNDENNDRGFQDTSNQELSIPLTMQGRSKTGNKHDLSDLRDSRIEYNERVEELWQYNNSHPKNYPPVAANNSILKEKENVLLNSVKVFKSRLYYDNRTRLGPSKRSIFHQLSRSRSSSETEHSASASLTGASSSCESDLPCDIGNIPVVHDEHIESLNFETDSEKLDKSVADLTLEFPISSEKSKYSFQSKIEAEVCDIEESSEVRNLDKDLSNSSTSAFTSVQDEVSCVNSFIDSDEETLSSKSSNNLLKTTETLNSNESNTTSSLNTCEKNSKQTRKRPVPLLPSERKAVEKGEGLENFMHDENDEKAEIDFVPLKLSIAIAIKKLIIGSSIRSFSQQWMGQSFVFSLNPKLSYGFVQNKGGSCGVLASVQGFLLKALLFDPNLTNEVDPLRPTRQEVRKALVHALTEVLWKAGGCKQAALVRSTGNSHLKECLVYRPDCLTESLSWKKFFCEQTLHETIEKHLEEFTSPLGKGCLRLMVSAILSRGIQSVLGDMDDETMSLVGPGGTCSLELVNLLVTGRAVSNVFDNDLQLGSCLLRGIPKRSEIGFLSVYEHFKSCQVGSNLKTPRYPIWLVNCENHFSIVFSPCKQLVSDWRAERQFHLYHYDGMISPSEESVITIDTTGFSVDDKTRKDDIPPLELCIKTKWKDAVVHWTSSSSQ